MVTPFLLTHESHFFILLITKSMLSIKFFAMIVDLREVSLMLALSPDVSILVYWFGRSGEEIKKMNNEIFKRGLIFPSIKMDPVFYCHVRHIIQ